MSQAPSRTRPPAATRRPRALDGTDAAHPSDVVARFDREAMPFLDRLYAAAIHLTDDRAAAEGLVEQTYVRAFGAFESSQAGSSLKRTPGGGSSGLGRALDDDLADVDVGGLCDRVADRFGDGRGVDADGVECRSQRALHVSVAT